MRVQIQLNELFRRQIIRAVGINKIRRCQKQCGHSAITTIISRRVYSFRSRILPPMENIFCEIFTRKVKNSILKPKVAGPAAYIFTANDPRPGGQAELLRLLQQQGCEVHKATAPFSATIPAKKGAKAETKQFPAGSYLVRMDQPYSRIADMMLDYQYWATNDPQTNIYDDTAWTFGELGNVQVARVTDVAVLSAPMEKVVGDVKALSGISGSGSTFIVNHNTDNALVTLRYQLKNASFESAEEPFEIAGQKFNRGSFIIRNTSADELGKIVNELGLKAVARYSAPTVKTHPVRVRRIAMDAHLADQARPRLVAHRI